MIMDDLITDRTELDRARVLELSAIGWTKMTTAQRAEWAASMKGAYTESDMNRVGNAVNYLVSYLNGMQAVLDAYRASYGVAADTVFNVTWASISVTGKTDWTDADEPSPAQLAAYLTAVSAATAAITIVRLLPETMVNLTVTGANEIEKALAAEHAAGREFEAGIKRLIERAALSWFYSGEIYCGEV